MVVFDSRLGSSSRLANGEQWLTGLSRSDCDSLRKYAGQLESKSHIASKADAFPW